MMLLLSSRDIRRLVPMRECIGVMEQALAALARGEALLPLRTVIRLSERPTFFALMPAFLPTAATIGAKVITVYPDNHGAGLDSHQGVVLLFEPAHGSLEAVLDASAITAIRTAAVSAVATRHLARDDARVLAILGSGVQARVHLEAIPLVREIERVRVWSRDTAHARSLADFGRDSLGIAVEVCPTAERAVRDADIVCTTTSAREPVLDGAWLRPGTHVNAIGSSTPAARELDATTVVRSRVYVDRRESALKESGDILRAIEEDAITPDHLVGELGDVIVGTTRGRESRDEITLFKSLGLAIEDLATARYAADRAAESGGGTRVDLGGGRE
jgi:ornithine cyclodeaminase/alanine dehydrogenase-like protein (mu-crystallin family)